MTVRHRLRRYVQIQSTDRVFFKSFGDPRVVRVNHGPVDVVAGEFTGDNIIDVAVSRSSMTDIVVFENDGTMQFDLYVDLPVGTAPSSPSLSSAPQCVVAVRPSSNPAAARTSDPVQTEVVN